MLLLLISVGIKETEHPGKSVSLFLLFFPSIKLFSSVSTCQWLATYFPSTSLRFSLTLSALKRLPPFITLSIMPWRSLFLPTPTLFLAPLLSLSHFDFYIRVFHISGSPKVGREVLLRWGHRSWWMGYMALANRFSASHSCSFLDALTLTFLFKSSRFCTLLLICLMVVLICSPPL